MSVTARADDLQPAAAQPEQLVAYAISDGPVPAIDKPLTGKPGDAGNGEKIMIANAKGNCLACHEVAALQHKAASDPVGYADMGQIGPRLDGVAQRYSQGQLRMLLVNPKQVFPQTLMPAYYRVDGLHRPSRDTAGIPILKAQEVEDVVAFLMKLTEPQRSEKVAEGTAPTTPVAKLYPITRGPSNWAIEASLTGKPGDAANGEKVMIANPKGNCFACHEVAALQHKAASDPVGYADMGQIGPRLDGVAKRYTEGELRMLLVDSKQVFPHTIMPAFLRAEGLHRPAKEIEGKTILQPQEVEDVVALLMKLNVDATAGMGGMIGMRDVK
jgi:sulfur-oxidizing protein SoxX